MFSVFETQTLTGRSRFRVLDFGYNTNNHPTFTKREKADAYIKQASVDPVKVAKAQAVKDEADAFRASIGLPAR